MPFRKQLLRLLPQAVLLLAVLALLLWFGHNVLENLRGRGIRAGFDFLSDPAGFEIGESLFAYDSGQPLWRAFLTGTANTLRVALPAIVLSTILGSLIGLGRLASHAVPRAVCTTLVETLRNIPLLLQLLMCYFALTSLLPEASAAISPMPGTLLTKGGLFLPGWGCEEGACGWSFPEAEGFGVSGGWSLSPEFLAVLIALTFYSAVFIAEIVRGGIQSVSRGQIDAARAIGLRPFQVLRHVVAPLALRAIVPPLGNQYLNLIKNSSLAVAVGYPELVSVANTSLNQTGRAFECIVIVMAVYLALSLLTALLVNLYNRLVALRGTA
ncbi:amino acid ABC transporter permease [Uliginosibacterium paludis]|uniref:ABC transporter permease subunit n=1 Tax=Uliginosibacterium paludis TaxID=1615952 RepID=A0ABV2CKV2_9RHOO